LAAHAKPSAAIQACLSIVSSMATAKSALARMMHIVAVTDPITEYQDFCGANPRLLRPQGSRSQ
jgi:hypothetical protein